MSSLACWPATQAVHVKLVINGHSKDNWKPLKKLEQYRL